MNYLYGILFTILGILIVARNVFKVNIPVFKIAFGMLFIFIGISLFISEPGESNNNIFFSNKAIQVTDLDKEYNLIFSRGTIDLSKVSPQNKGQKLKINTIFSDGTIVINPQTPALISTNSAFAITETPDDASISFGKYKYLTKSYEKERNYLQVETKTVFSKLEVKDTVAANH